jgi:hypothetical protein
LFPGRYETPITKYKNPPQKKKEFKLICNKKETFFWEHKIITQLNVGVVQKTHKEIAPIKQPCS